jgi:ferredoxin-NADP reductase
MLRHHAAVGSEVPARLLYSSRSYEELIYREELMGYASRGHVKVDFTLTRQQPADWIGFRRRIDREILAAVSPPPGERPLIYVCGPTPFVESAASTLVELGHEATRIRTERFGPTG